ncbi:hypothetical protein RPATATE_0508 [Rickettsia parkeri str. Tate's Hell]|uniref:Uncharacterized protein n=1 Tax=Rickettsia parkeri str. Tate's Hell TaxID=1359189 RepID=A0ABR5DN19_RICPA|nr:hypothetical protein RPAAT24_0416 [Rickettsia parkeri str. AT\
MSTIKIAGIKLDIQSGNADMTAGATYTTERSCNGYYSQN